jgi:hypothetical protein
MKRQKLSKPRPGLAPFTPLAIVFSLLACGEKAAEPASTPPGGSPAAADAGGSAPPVDAARTPDTAPAGMPSGAVPASASRMDIEAFIMAGGYKQAPWISETPAPRARGAETSPHDRVRVFMNPELVTSLRAGRDGFKDPMTQLNHPPHDSGSMAVKELYDEADMLVGVAAMLKTEPGIIMNSWTYYCYGPEGRCLTNMTATREAPAYGKGFGVACGFCHGGLVYTKVPPQ